jgi:hypothetical protein
MNWENVILVLGSATLTAIVSIAGNFINAYFSERKALREQKQLIIKDYMNQRIKAYDHVLDALNTIDESISNNEVLRNSDIKDKLYAYEAYYSADVIEAIHYLLYSSAVKSTKSIQVYINRIKTLIRNELDNYLEFHKKKNKPNGE